jgi:hypothetical protein
MFSSSNLKRTQYAKNGLSYLVTATPLPPPPMSEMGLGRVKTGLKGRWFSKPGPGRSQAAIRAIRGLIPTMFMTRVRL